MKNLLYSRIQLLIHLVVWLIIIHFLFNIEGLYYSFYEAVNDNIIDDAFIIIPVLIGGFYINYSILVPRFLNKKQWIIYVAWVFILFFGLLFLTRILFDVLHQQGINFLNDLADIYDLIPLTLIITLATSISLSISKRLMISEQHKEQALKQQQEAELNFLKTQINPHFLFNSLNGIHYLTELENAPKSTNAILKLAEIMRYPINEGAQQQVPLELELNFIKNYIDFQKIRLGEQYPVSLTITGETNHKIPPLLFIPVIENAFKYGVSPSKLSPITITFNITDNELQFYCENHIIKQQVPSHKTGVANLKSRLAILYPKQHELAIKQSEANYNVSLTLNFKQDN